VAEPLSISEVAAETGVSAHTLRYYERIGLLASVPRARSGHRRYGDEDLRWIRFLRKMQATGMPIRKMLAYARLVRRGDATAGERRAILEDHRAEVVARLAELHECLDLIDKKIAMYESVEHNLKSLRETGAVVEARR
jgi:DNA-binding transcriptional MerR regulator